jgi:arylsulfatase A-like enzyme
MGTVRNILFIMTDQQRADYLGAELPALRTPVLDALARDGVRFSRAYCNSPICGSSRMCFYTGRYMSTHGATWNRFPLSVSEWTIGDHLAAAGQRVGLVGKTHMAPDRQGMQRLGLAADDARAGFLAECGFEPWERDDGLWPDGVVPADLPYNRWLNAHGFDGENPWHTWANSAAGPDGEILSGWYLRNVHLPARIPEAFSETAYMTDRAIAFVDDAGATPWCLHLSYIKPHWPYMAPAPYHAMYGPEDVPAVIRGSAERDDPHPVHAAFMQHEDSRTFARDGVRDRVVPPYMGLVSQIDTHLGRLFDHLKKTGAWDNTLIVFTSDHGDYLGDHWLGEKELFHEPSLRIPMIIRDPDPAADAQRGSVRSEFVESVDLLATFRDALGLPGEDGQRLEGRSVLPLLRGPSPADWRDAVFAETDFAPRGARLSLGLAPNEARGIMVRTDRWKFIHWHGFRPQLFDMQEDPQEFHDRGVDPSLARVRDAMRDRLVDHLLLRRTRDTISDTDIEARTDTSARAGFLIGRW